MDYGEEVDVELSSDDEDYKPNQSAESSDDEIDNEDHHSDNLEEDSKPSRKVEKNNRRYSPKCEIKHPNENLMERDTEEEKQRLENLWSDFLKGTSDEDKNEDCTELSRNEQTKSLKENADTSTAAIHGSMSNENQTLKLFETRGDIEHEAKIDIPPHFSEHDSSKSIGTKRPKGDLSSLLGQFSKKQKTSVLEKSQKDWKNFKDNEGINEELKTFNRGRNG